jgi:hypothetical protein
MKTKWNVNPSNASTVARLLSELEGVTYILECLDNVEEELNFINEMKKKYYKEYFKLNKYT